MGSSLNKLIDVLMIYSPPVEAFIVGQIGDSVAQASFTKLKNSNPVPHIKTFRSNLTGSPLEPMKVAVQVMTLTATPKAVMISLVDGVSIR